MCLLHLAMMLIIRWITLRLTETAYVVLLQLVKQVIWWQLVLFDEVNSITKRKGKFKVIKVRIGHIKVGLYLLLVYNKGGAGTGAFLLFGSR